jgi:transcriptional regulator with XRE-family HTH domain
MSLAENIKKFRNKKQLSQPELATRANVSKAYIYMLEAGETDNPRLDMLQKIADALDCTIGDLIGKGRMALKKEPIEIPEALLSFARKRKREGDPLNEDDLVNLARIQFRGRRPQSEEDWAYLYQFFKRTFESES